MAERKISIEQVQHVARLAQLELPEAEMARMQHDLSDILTHIEKLNELDTAAVEPTTQVGEAGTPMREDVASNRPAVDALLANAPSRHDNLFRVPRIIE